MLPGYASDAHKLGDCLCQCVHTYLAIIFASVYTHICIMRVARLGKLIDIDGKKKSLK